MISPSRFDEVLEASHRRPGDREAYLSSYTGKARVALARADQLASALRSRLGELSAAMTRGDGSEAASIRMNAALLDLRLMCADAEGLVRLSEDEGFSSRNPPQSDPQEGRSPTPRQSEKEA